MDAATGIGLGAVVLRNLGITNVYGIDSNEKCLEYAVRAGRLERSHAIRGNLSKLVGYFGKEYFGSITAFNAPVYTIYDKKEDNTVNAAELELAIASWEKEIPSQIMEVLQPQGLVLFTLTRESEMSLVRKVFGPKLIEIYCKS